MRMLLGVLIASSMSIGAPACGGKKAQPTAEPVANEAAGSATTTAGSAESAGSAATGAGSAAPGTCEAEGGKCISKVAAVACGTKSHDGGCPNNGYCCIQ